MKCRVLVVQSAAPKAGLYCHDVLNQEESFLMDLGLSRTLRNGDAALATRTIPLGEYWMTSGAGLPISPEKAALQALSEMSERESLKGPGRAALSIVRACLAAGAAKHAKYKSAAAKPEKPRREPRWPWFKRHR